MTFCRPAALLVAALAGRAASAVKQAAKKTRLVPVLKLMTNASYIAISHRNIREGFQFHGRCVAYFNSNCSPVSQLGVGEGAPRRRAASTVVRIPTFEPCF